MHRIRLRGKEIDYMRQVFKVKVDDLGLVDDKWTDWFKGRPGDEGVDAKGRNCRFVIEKWITSEAKYPQRPVTITKRYDVKFYQGKKEKV